MRFRNTKPQTNLLFGFCILYFGFCLLTSAQGGLENIPTDSRLYEDIDLLKASGLISTLPSTSRPWTRKELLRLFLEADSNSKFQNLNLAQRGALARLRWEFGEELQTDRRRKPAFSFHLDEGAIRADLFSRVRLNREKQRLGIGTVLNNRPNDRFFFYERIEMSLLNPAEERVFDSSGCHNPNVRVIAWRDRVLFEMERAYFGWKLPSLRLEIGRDEFFWGPGYLSSVMLSDNAPALDHIQFLLAGRNLKFISFTAMLSRWNERHRFLSAQRLEVALFNRLTLGGAMFNVYTYESAQDFSGMLNPLLPLYFSVANSGHGDNLLVGWDGVLYLPQTKIYGQFLIDNYEFNSRRSAPNCVGLQAGLFLVPQAPVDFRLEYTLVTAFTYYHRLRDIMFENYSVPLGHEIGPDADRLWARLRITPGKHFNASLFTSWTRRGYYNRGDYERKCFDEAVDTVFLRHYYQFPARGRDSLGNIIEEVEKVLSLGPEFEVTLLPDPSAQSFRDCRGIPFCSLGAGLYFYGRVGPAFYFNRNGVCGDNRIEPEFLIKLEYRY